MNYLSQLIKDELRYICLVVPYQDTIAYFSKNPKQFVKIRPGFRVKAISKDMASELLFDFSSKPFISYFIEKHISDWLSQIKKHYNNRIEAGDSKDVAFLNTLPFCFFAENVGLYFKLINEEYSEEYIALMGAAIKSIKEVTDERDRLSKELKTRDSDIRNLHTELNSAKLELDRTRTESNKRLSEIDAFKIKLAGLQGLRIAASKDKQKIDSLENEIITYEETIKELRIELDERKVSSSQLEEQIRKELERLQTAKVNEQQSIKAPKCPSDINEFKDYLGYNLENIGVPDVTYYALLKEHLSKILFQGIPILVNRSTGINVMNCVANALIGRPTINTLVFNKDISAEEVNRFLSLDGRIVCLDNFLGNFNETELLPLFEKHRDKIVFLTVAYDRTIHYISKEFLRYCHYLNVNRIKALTVNVALTEDPSTIVEVDFDPQWASAENRYSKLLREVLRELEFPQSLIEQKCAAVFDEQDLCRLLAFDVLPYCIDVLQIAPYTASERLLKYAGDTGRCSHKELFKEWFAI
ncbi:hypothetical protein EDC14_102661 [Hydrogenispora ethanolica]|uniref:Uncharacterized protein n=1 Tax=Hydrogenispora ethanolica TaxID=1082276 RepID=A0A4V2QCZ3_HYDET|nr:hypothetical protein [Hydrogenispora ethanolica]TCL62317.1 hypothetical protein EDC14_102661 [Hydrogenispora ethanolica]